MEYINNNALELLQPQPVLVDESPNNKVFIEANTVECSLNEMRNTHSIPVWLKDSEQMISHVDFIELTSKVLKDKFHGEKISNPIVRVSHPLKGKVASARDKPTHLLRDDEKTLSYERCMFCIEIPSITSEVGDNTLSLVVGGVKSFSEDNLYQRSGGDQHFRFFIGFENRVCTNLNIWSDGYSGLLTVKDTEHLHLAVNSIVQRYNSGHHLYHLRQLAEHTITESEFAHLVGRCRIYQNLPNHLKKELPEILLTDTQINMVVRDYYRDKSFCRSKDGTISLWKVYNLLTGANKTSYINDFVDRSVNAYNFIEQIRWALEGKSESWYLN